MTITDEACARGQPRSGQARQPPHPGVAAAAVEEELEQGESEQSQRKVEAAKSRILLIRSVDLDYGDHLSLGTPDVYK